MNGAGWYRPRGAGFVTRGEQGTQHGNGHGTFMLATMGTAEMGHEPSQDEEMRYRYVTTPRMF